MMMIIIIIIIIIVVVQKVDGEAKGKQFYYSWCPDTQVPLITTWGVALLLSVIAGAHEHRRA